MESQVWQLAFGALITTLLFWRPISVWISKEFAKKKVFPLGYLFAAVYTLSVIGALEMISAFRPTARFDDFFLFGIVVAAYLFGAAPAMLLLGLALAFCAWILPPSGSFRIAATLDLYRLFSFAMVSLVLILAVLRLKTNARQQPASRQAYLFTTGYAIVGTLVTMFAFHAQPIPRFNDIFLVGIAVVASLFTTSSAAYLLAIAVGVSAWILPPGGSFAVTDPTDYYRILSFCAVSGLLIFLSSRLKKPAGEDQALVQ
jgi:K+-sensing histidine kinase KdpD